jgi:hypothetical protein
VTTSAPVTTHRRYPVNTRLGRHQRLDSRSLWFFHHHDRAQVLKPSQFEPAVPVLDQEDLHAQGIVVSQVVPGAADVDALGSCSGNTATAAVSRILTPAQATAVGLSYTDRVGAERWAIDQYARATQVDAFNGGMPQQDTGSSGLANAQVLKARGLIGGYTHATDASSLASLLQRDGVMLGTTWYNAFFNQSGVAGGHEIYLTGLETVVQDKNGNVVADKTVAIARNSWSNSWGDNGHFRVRLSTLFSAQLRPALDCIQIHA